MERSFKAVTPLKEEARALLRPLFFALEERTLVGKRSSGQRVQSGHQRASTDRSPSLSGHDFLSQISPASCPPQWLTMPQHFRITGSEEDCWLRRAVPEVTSCSTAGPLFGLGPGSTAIISHESFHMGREAAVSHRCFSCLPTKKKRLGAFSCHQLTSPQTHFVLRRKQGFALSQPPLENTHTSVGYP
ncbi:hypothetical protein EYF80_027404 [Liparis tanakae]|uniref:Uncharacterized protein n=1 Tax=Liparis tanakae TaxID=230148 RepID=A0A4Z2HBL3_9TELE|nr:hypothetical protein EYF80_027404 [Liparis tanakae]